VPLTAFVPEVLMVMTGQFMQEACGPVVPMSKTARSKPVGSRGPGVASPAPGSGGAASAGAGAKPQTRETARRNTGTVRMEDLLVGCSCSILGTLHPPLFAGKHAAC
jgi:hypothetical protein